VVLLRRGPVQRSGFWSELEVDRFAVGLISKLKVGAVAFGRVERTGAPELGHISSSASALYVCRNSVEVPPEFQEPLHVPFQGGILRNLATSVLGNKNT
jgi:hypothetical protein